MAKTVLFEGIRLAHRLLASRPLPDRLALYFHELEEHQWPAFRAAFRALAAEGYAAVDLATYLEAASAGRKLFVSFDDNYASWHRALPLLEELGVTATFYVNTLPFRDRATPGEIDAYFERIAHRGERLTLSRAELVEIRKAGHAIGCHTHSHFVLSRLPPQDWDGEIAASRQILQDLLGEEVAHFSYPYGMRRFFSAALADYCRRIGFRTIAAAIPGLQYVRPIDPFAIHRTRWVLSAPIERNLQDLSIDGRAFERLTGRSAVG